MAAIKIEGVRIVNGAPRTVAELVVVIGGIRVVGARLVETDRGLRLAFPPARDRRSSVHFADHALAAEATEAAVRAVAALRAHGEAEAADLPQTA